MKILVVTPVIRPGGGPAGYTYNLQSAIEDSADDLRNTFFFCGKGSEQRTSQLHFSLGRKGPHSLAISRLNSLTRGAPRRARNLHRSLTSASGRQVRSAMHDADVVVFQGFQPPHLARYASRLGNRVVYMPHSPTPVAQERSMVAENSGVTMPSWEVEAFQREEAELFALADTCVFPSKGAMGPYRAAFARELTNKDIRLIPSAVPEPEVPGLEERSGGREKPILFVGRYVSHKGYDLFCETARVLSQDPGWTHRFVSIGTGPLKANEHVEDLGWQNSPHALVSTAETVVVANRISYYDLLPLETAGLGVPLVMTPVGGNVDQAKLLPASVLAADTSPESIAEAIRESVKRNAITPDWGAGNRRAYEQHFTLARLARSWDQEMSNLGPSPVEA